MSMVQLSKLKIFQPTISQSATRGEKIAKENKLKLLKSNQHIKERPASLVFMERSKNPVQ